MRRLAYVSKSAVPSPLVSMSTNGIVLTPRLYQLPHVATPNASSDSSGLPWALASGAVEAAPT